MKGAIAAILALIAAASAGEPLILEKTIPLPGVRGRFDHFSVDAAGKRLAVAALGNDTVEVIDLAAGARMATVTGQSKPCGVLFVPGAARLVIANGGEGVVRTYDAGKLKEVAKLASLDDADNVRWDSARGRVVVGFGEGALAVVNERGDQLVGRVALAAHPEAFQLESKGRRAFVNVPSARQVAVVDMEKREVIATWPLGKWRANFPMALDEAHGRLFLGCRSPARLVELDITGGRVVADCEIAGDTDDLFYDAKRSRIYVSAGEGFLDTVRVESDGKLTRESHQPTRKGARTSFYSESLDRLYLAVPESGGEAAELRVYQPR